MALRLVSPLYSLCPSFRSLSFVFFVLFHGVFALFLVSSVFAFVLFVFCLMLLVFSLVFSVVSLIFFVVSVPPVWFVVSSLGHLASVKPVRPCLACLACPATLTGEGVHCHTEATEGRKTKDSS